MKPKFIYSLLFVFFIPLLRLYAENTDSILSSVSLSAKKERLTLLYKYSLQYPTNLSLIEALEKEAIAQDSYLDLASAYKSKVYFYTRIGALDSTKLYLNQTKNALDLYDDIKETSQVEKERYNNIVKMLYTTQTALYLHEGKYHLALIEIKHVLDNPKVTKTSDFEIDLFTLSGMMFLNLGNYEMALSSFLESGRLLEETTNDSNIGKYSYYMNLEGISRTYAGLNNYMEALKVINTLIDKIEDEYNKDIAINGYNPEAEFVYNYFKHQALMFKIHWLIRTNQLQKAKLDLDRLQWFLKEELKNQHTDFDLFYFIEAEYYFEIKKYILSEQKIKTLINRLSIQELYPLYYESNILLSKILNAKGESKEAYSLMVDINRMNDSIRNLNFSTELGEIEILYEVDKSKRFIKQKETELKVTQVILLFIVIVLAFFFVILFLILKSRNALLEKNKKLVNQAKIIAESNKKINKLENLQTASEYHQEVDSYQSIINKLDTLFENDRVYLNEDVNREEIALELGTNRQYLIEAIKAKKGKTFNEYVNFYRLTYAYELIVNDKNKNISEILNESGFSTRATFYKNFKEMYGLTPSELRNL